MIDGENFERLAGQLRDARYVKKAAQSFGDKILAAAIDDAKADLVRALPPSPPTAGMLR